MHEQAHCRDKAANHQLHVVTAFWIIWIVSGEECSSLMQNLMQIHCSTCSVILNATATHYTCSLNNIYCLHCPVQWVHIHACTFQSSLLCCQVTPCHTNHSCCINNGWTFPGPTIYICMYAYTCMHAYTCVYMHICICMHVCTHTYICMYIFLRYQSMF